MVKDGVSPHKHKRTKFSMNTSMKLHQKLFLKVNSKKKQSSFEKLLTPFAADLLQNPDLAKVLQAKPTDSDGSVSSDNENHSSDSERDSSEIREKKEKQKQKKLAHAKKIVSKHRVSRPSEAEKCLEQTWQKEPILAPVMN